MRPRTDDVTEPMIKKDEKRDKRTTRGRKASRERVHMIERGIRSGGKSWNGSSTRAGAEGVIVVYSTVP